MFTTNDNGKKRLREIVDDIKTCMFTTTDAECNVFSRPMLTIKIDNELKLWFFSTESSANIKERTDNKQATLVYSHPGKNTYMNIYGTCAVVEDRGKIKDLWTPALKSWFQQGIDDPSLCLVQVIVDKAMYWDNSTNEMIPLVKAESHNAYQTVEQADLFIPQVSNW